jgi:hypothetical protein
MRCRAEPASSQLIRRVTALVLCCRVLTWSTSVPGKVAWADPTVSKALGG